jgi:hypothetical protein
MSLDSGGSGKVRLIGAAPRFFAAGAAFFAARRIGVAACPAPDYSEHMENRFHVRPTSESKRNIK